MSVFDEISLTNELLVELIDNINGGKDLKDQKPVNQESGTESPTEGKGQG